MPINSNNHKIGDLYAGIYKKKQDQLNESVKKQHVVSESLKSAYLPSTPFHKYLTDYDQMYNNYRSTVILKESFNNDINTAITDGKITIPEVMKTAFDAAGLFKL